MQTRTIDTKFQAPRTRLSDRLMNSNHGTLDQRFIRYLFKLKKKYLSPDQIPSVLKLPAIDRSRIELTKEMVKHESDDRFLFHLSITYRPFNSRIYQETDVNNFFTNFYQQGLLPYLLGTEDISRPDLLEFHPITYCFVDEHEHPRAGYTFPVRLHHHAVVAIHPVTIGKMMMLRGTRTLSSLPMSQKIATSQVTDTRPPAVLYASKKMPHYPDYLHFGQQDYAPAASEFVPNPAWDNFQSAAVARHRYRNY
jgi:hypothetical protein